MNPASTAAVNHGDSERAEIRKGGRPRKYRTVEQAHTAEMELQPLRRNSPNEATPPLAACRKQKACRRENRLSAVPIAEKLLN